MLQENFLTRFFIGDSETEFKTQIRRKELGRRRNFEKQKNKLKPNKQTKTFFFALAAAVAAAAPAAPACLHIALIAAIN